MFFNLLFFKSQIYKISMIWKTNRHYFSFFSQMYCHSSLIAPKLPFDCTNTLLRLYWHAPSIVVVLSFDCTDSFLWFYWNAEPSTLTRRAFAIATPNARQVDDEPSATSWIQRKASVSPHMRFWKLPKAPQWIHTCASVNPLISFSSFVLCTLSFVLCTLSFVLCPLYFSFVLCPFYSLSLISFFFLIWEFR